MSECDDPKCACHGAAEQLAWMEEMERIEQEIFPDARPRSEVIVQVAGTPSEDA
jgi:hypothetical protein